MAEFPFIKERYDEISNNSFFLKEMEVILSIPDGFEYYDHIIKNIDIDKSNTNNSYIMYACGKADVIDKDSSCVFVEAASSLPDIDVDFPPSYREKAIDYVKDKYGHECVSQVVTFSRLQGRSALKEVMTSEGCHTFDLMNSITENIPDEAEISDQLVEMENPSILRWVLEESPKLVSDYCYLDDSGNLCGDYKEQFRKALILEGTLKSQGKHAAGVIISSSPVKNYAPMILPSRNKDRVCGFEMKAAEKSGLVKFDFLGVEILEKIQKILGPDLNKYPTDDSKVWELLESGNTKGVFQLESSLGRTWAKEIRPKSIEEISDLISVLRPGTLQSKEDGKTMIQHFVDRRNKKTEIPKIHEKVDSIIEKTYGIILYQEQAMNVCRSIASFSMVQANKLRKAIGKKIASLMKEVKEEFIEKCKENNIDSSISDRVFNMIESSSRYSFNRCLSPNTLVETKDEIKSLEEIEIGEFIKCPDFNSGKDIFVKVVDKIDTGEKEVFEITLDSGQSIISTIDHEYLCFDGKKRPLYEILEKNMSIVCE